MIANNLNFENIKILTAQKKGIKKLQTNDFPQKINSADLNLAFRN
jgi:hypothetical protein